MSRQSKLPIVVLAALASLLLFGCAKPAATPTAPASLLATPRPTEARLTPLPTDAASPTAAAVAAAIASATIQATTSEAAATAPKAQVTIPPPPTFPPFVPAPAWEPDGIVAPNEYTDATSIGDVALSWAHDGDSLYLAMSGPTTGWVAIGISPENRMQGANYILGFVADGQASVFDAYGTEPTGATHPVDTDLGGSDDILAAGGRDAAGMTVIEAKIPLASGDAYDKPLEPGNTYPVIVAFGSGDEFNARHTFRGAGEITLSP